MRLVLVGRSAWCVMAITDGRGQSFINALRAADPADDDARKMRVMLERDIPDGGPVQGNRSKALGGGIFEFRRGRLRVLWFYDQGEPRSRNLIICSSMFQKKGTRAKGTPPQEIEAARKQLRDYQEAKKAGALDIEAANR